MPVRISELINDLRTTTVEVGNQEIVVHYRPNAITLENMSEMEGLQENQYRRLAELLCLFIESWDITDDNDRPITVVPENLLRMPFRLLMSIFAGVRDDLDVDADEKKASPATSGATSSRRGKRGNARNGTQSSAQRGTWA